MIKNDHYSTDILEVLQVMKSVFIDRQLCILVTEQGIAQVWPELAESIFTDLQDFELIDDAGTFLSNVTLESIQTYCETESLSPDYLKHIYNMQQYCNSLRDKELSFWNHKLHELHLRFNIQDLTEGSVDDPTFDEILMYVRMLIQHYGDNSVSKIMLALHSKKERVHADLLLDLFKKCATREWIFEIVIHELTQKASDPLSVIHQHLQAYHWETEFSKSRIAKNIIASIKSHIQEDDLVSKLDVIVTKLNDIKDIENNRRHSSLIQEHSRPICEYTKEDIKHWAVVFRESAGYVKHKHLKLTAVLTKSLTTSHVEQAPFDHTKFVVEAFAVIRRGITIFYDTEKSKKNIIPRDTQMVASLLFLENLSAQGGASQGTRLMQQISTGEGKTMIICMTAIFKALLGEKVDIVTSSSVLATRDATEQKALYGLFDVSVSHCCHEELTKRCQAYEADVN